MTTYYRNGYKGQLAKDRTIEVPEKLIPPDTVEMEFIRLDADGILLVKEKYAWDYASGPTLDRPRKKIITPTLVHDALCQLERAGKMTDVKDARKHADKFFYDLLLERKFWWPRARLWYRGVRIGSKLEGQNKETLEAP
jgi:hypothetical protein